MASRGEGLAGAQAVEQHQQSYLGDGLTILRGVIPGSLLGDLRREADKARDIARCEQGPQAQRLQPVWDYDELDHGPFRDFRELPQLRAVVEAIFGEPRTRQGRNSMGILFEPAGHAWATCWHRDVYHHTLSEAVKARHLEARRDLRMFNQLNAALYDDHSLWVVPGSHARDDTPEELALTPEPPAFRVDVPEDLQDEDEREVWLTGYARRMPQATQVVLLAGDIALYRNPAWHLGRYVPYVRRATLHDAFSGDADVAWDEFQQAQDRMCT
jgi:Phytanoyl-CoA dioxygenase (PhyH)